MKQMKRRIVAVILVIIFILGNMCISEERILAVSKNKQALKAYETLLANETYLWYNGESHAHANETKNYSFSCVDINKDGVDELLVHNGAACFAERTHAVFAYVGGEVKCVLKAPTLSWYKKGKILGVEYGHTGDYSGDFYRLGRSGKLINKASYYGTDMKEYADKVKHKEGCIYYTSYKINGKEVSYKTYNRKFSRLVKSKSSAQITYVKNTAANRKDVFK